MILKNLYTKNEKQNIKFNLFKNWLLVSCILNNKLIILFYFIFTVVFAVSSFEEERRAPVWRVQTCENTPRRVMLFV